MYIVYGNEYKVFDVFRVCFKTCLKVKANVFLVRLIFFYKSKVKEI